jgi:ABC-type amino acid transport substrate-binding protein
MNRHLPLLMPPLIGFCLACGAHAQGAPTNTTPQKPTTAGVTADSDARALEVRTRAQKVDFDQMLERRAIKFYLPYSRSLYFIDKGRERGISAGVIREFERWVNKKYAKQLGKRPMTVFAVVATRDKLLADLQGGYADVAVGNVKVLDELLKEVDFAGLDQAITTTEILVTGPASPAIASIDDLSGKTVHVREYSSQYLGLKALNERFRKAGGPRPGRCSYLMRWRTRTCSRCSMPGCCRRSSLTTGGRRCGRRCCPR